MTTIAQNGDITNCAACHALVRMPHTCPHTVSQAAALPEAPASLNVYVETPAGRIQATARGTDPAATVAQLATLVEAIKTRFATPRPRCIDCGHALDHERHDQPRCVACLLAAERARTREERLGLLLARGLTCAVGKGDAALADRLSKAAYLVLSGAVEPSEREQAMVVRSQTTPTTWYTIEGNHCSCLYAAKQPNHSCKHILAIALWQRLESAGA